MNLCSSLRSRLLIVFIVLWICFSFSLPAEFPLRPTRQSPSNRFVVYPGTERFPLDDITDAIGVIALAKALQSVK
jgi:hypothetical protein